MRAFLSSWRVGWFRSPNTGLTRLTWINRYRHYSKMSSGTDKSLIPIFYKIPFGSVAEIVSGYLEKRKWPRGSKQKRFYGHFECPKCNTQWSSGTIWQGYTQGCQRCKKNKWPIKVYHLDESTDISQGGGGSHVSELCEKCQELGHNCLTGAKLDKDKIKYPFKRKHPPDKFEKCFIKQYQLFSYNIKLEPQFIPTLYEKLRDEWTEEERKKFHSALRDAEKEWRRKGIQDMVKVCEQVLQKLVMGTATKRSPKEIK